MAKEMNRFLVTGGAGCVGQNIVRKLLEMGKEVTVFDDFSAYPKSWYESTFDKIEKADGVLAVRRENILNKNAVAKIMKDTDAVIHCAAFADVAGSINDFRKDFDVNVKGTMNMLEAAKEAGVQKFTFISSAAVYGSPMDKLFREEQPLHPSSNYAVSKLWGEHQTRIFNELYGLPTTAIRYFSVYGPPQTPKLGSHSWCCAIFAMKALKCKPVMIYHDGSQIRDFISVQDAAEGTIRATLSSKTDGKVFNMGTGRPTTIEHIKDLIFRHVDAVPTYYTPLIKGDPLGGYAETKEIRFLLDGWEPQISIEQGVKDYVDWIKQHQDLIPKWI